MVKTRNRGASWHAFTHAADATEHGGRERLDSSISVFVFFFFFLLLM